MKNYKHFLHAGCIILFVFSTSQLQAQDVTITVTVDTDGIWNSPSRIKDFVKLSDGVSVSDFGSNHKNFETEVGLSKDIEWIALITNSSSSDVIAVEDVIMKGDVNSNEQLLEKPSYSNNGNGKVKGKAISTPKPNKKHHYNINISVTRGTETRMFVIDPKIRLGSN